MKPPVIALIVAALLFPVCTRAEKKVTANEPATPQETPAPKQIAPPMPTSMDELDDKHPLEAGDRVMIKIAEDRDRKTSVWVQDNGNINCPYVGPVHAAGRTCKQLAGDIKRELEKKYFAVATVIIMHDPDPHRIIFCQGPPCFIIFGEVARQGKYELGLDEEITITQAILRAGGTASPASLRKVKLIRKTPKGNKTIIVNVDDILRHGKTSEDIPVHNGDVIIVPEPVHVPF